MCHLPSVICKAARICWEVNGGVQIELVTAVQAALTYSIVCVKMASARHRQTAVSAACSNEHSLRCTADVSCALLEHERMLRSKVIKLFRVNE